jgi:hypothetical protein
MSQHGDFIGGVSAPNVISGREQITQATYGEYLIVDSRLNDCLARLGEVERKYNCWLASDPDDRTPCDQVFVECQGLNYIRARVSQKIKELTAGETPTRAGTSGRPQ